MQQCLFLVSDSAVPQEYSFAILTVNCFRYIPPSMRGQEETPIWWRDISRVTTKIKESMVLDGSLMIGYTPLPNIVNFFRMVVSCEPPPTEASMDYVISQIEKLGTDL